MTRNHPNERRGILQNQLRETYQSQGKPVNDILALAQKGVKNTI